MFSWLKKKEPVSNIKSNPVVKKIYSDRPIDADRADFNGYYKLAYGDKKILGKLISKGPKHEPISNNYFVATRVFTFLKDGKEYDIELGVNEQLVEVMTGGRKTRRRRATKKTRKVHRRRKH